MSRRILTIAVCLFISASLLLLLPVGTIVSQDITDVFVTNFPKVQEVEGTVSVEGPIRNASLTRLESIIVNPVSPTDTTRLIDAGNLVTDGFPYLVLSLTGQVKGEVAKVGSVGALLIPDEKTIVQAFNEEGRVIFPLRVTASGVSRSSAYFDSDQPRFVVGFPEYKVLLYNTTDKTVEVDLFAYLTN